MASGLGGRVHARPLFVVGRVIVGLRTHRSIPHHAAGRPMTVLRADLDLAAPNRILREFVERRNIPLVDVLPAFHAGARGGATD